MPDHKQEPLVRSSAAEYLTFVAATGDSTESMEMRYEDENIWLTQKMMAALYDVSVSAINQHLKTIFEDGELEKDSVIKKYLITEPFPKKRTQESPEKRNETQSFWVLRQLDDKMV